MNSDLDTQKPGTRPGLPALSRWLRKTSNDGSRTGLCASLFCDQTLKGI